MKTRRKIVLLASIASLCGVAFADFDENGATPKYWLKFDGSAAQCGESDVPLNTQNFAYGPTRLGSSAHNCQAWTSSNLSFPADNGGWTVVESFRSVDTTNQVVWALGRRGDSNGIALVSGGTNMVNVVTWSNGGDVETLISASVDESLALYHCYAVVANPADGTVKLYVDGETGPSWTAEFAGNPGNASLQFGSVYSGCPAGLVNSAGTALEHDDWRFYHAALTAAEVAAIAENYPPWKEPDYSQSATWIGGDAGDWNERTNWDLFWVPGERDSVLFTNAAEVAITQDIAPSNLVLNADVVFSGSHTITPYEVGGNGKITLKGADLGAHSGAGYTVSNALEIPEGYATSVYGNNANIVLAGPLSGAGALNFNAAAGYCGAGFACDCPDFGGTLTFANKGINRPLIAGANAGFTNGTLVIRALTGITVAEGEFHFGAADIGNYQLRCQNRGVYTYVFGEKNVDSTVGANFWRSDSGGTITIRKVGAANLDFSGWNYSYLELEGGTLAFTTENDNLPNNELRFMGGVWTWGAGQETPRDISAKVKNSTGAIAVDTSDYTIEFATELDASNVGGLVKKGVGTLVLKEVPLYGGDTVVEAGTLVLPCGTVIDGALGLGEDATIVLDFSKVHKSGEYDAISYAELAEGTELRADNVSLTGLSDNARSEINFTEGGRVVVTVTMEPLVWNGDGADWTTSDAWLGGFTSDPRTFASGDPVRFDVTEANKTNTVLVTTAVDPSEATVNAGGEGACQLVKGHGTLTGGTIAVDGVLALAGDAEGPLVLATTVTNASESAGGVLIESGEVVLEGALAIDSVNNARVVRHSEWTPTHAMSGNGELLVTNSNFHVDHSSRFKDFAGTITLGEGGYLWDDEELHAEGNGQSYYGLGEFSKIRMAGGRISRFGRAGGSNNEYIGKVEVVDGTTNEWYNYESRSGNTGCNVNVAGDMTGSGVLKLHSNGRGYVFTDDLADFDGVLELDGTGYRFNNGIAGGMVVAKRGAYISNEALGVVGATLLLDNRSPNMNVSVAADSILGGGTNTLVKSVVFMKGAKLAFIDEDALSNPKETYVGVTSTTPVAGALPEIAQVNDGKGRWKAFVRENVSVELVEEVEVEVRTYSVCAEFRPSGLCISIR